MKSHHWLYAHRGFGMTLIAHALGDSHILLGADCALTYVDTDPPPDPAVAVPIWHERASKIRQVPDRPIVWALVGPVNAVKPFKEWASSAPLDDWGVVATEVSGLIDRLNQEALRRGHAAKKKRAEVQQSSAIIVGNIDDRLDVLVVDQEGTPYFPGSADLPGGFMGPFAGPVQVAWAAVAAFDPSLSLAQPHTMHTFLNSVCFSLNHLGTPVEVWKVTKDACGPVSENESI